MLLVACLIDRMKDDSIVDLICDTQPGYNTSLTVVPIIRM